MAGAKKKLLMKNGFTYYRHSVLKEGTRWSCTSCNAFIQVTEDNIIIKSSEDHNHEPFKLFKATDGSYVKL